jgi:aryl-alcohol dehydrogenase-like predicted oxidoreductase
VGVMNTSTRDIPIVLGTMNYGTTVPESTAHQLLDRFVERGGRWLDTANCYSFWNDPSGVGGASERVLGRWLAARPRIRDRVLISTKVRHQPMVPHRWPDSSEGLSATAIERGLRGSLERLGVEHVDLLWAHAEDRSVELAETVETFGAAVEAGTVRRLGASNHCVWRVERARTLARERGLAGYTALQLRYSYLQPRPGTAPPGGGHRWLFPDDLDYASSEPGVAVWAYSSMLDGAYVRADRPVPGCYDHPGTTRRLAVLAKVAAEKGVSANQVVLAWLRGHGPGVSPIIGVSSLEQLDEAMDSLDLDLGELRQRLDEPT